MTIIKAFYAQPMILIYLEALAMFVIWTAAMLLLRGKDRRIAALAGAVVSFALILFFTMYGRSGKMDTIPDFLPLVNFVESDMKLELWRSMFLNIMLFIPLGVSLPFVLSEKVKHNILITVLSGAAVSAIVELVQLIFAIGKFDFNDIIMNTLGTAIGTVSFVLVSLILRKTDER